MGFFQKFPYTGDHQLNLDWILRLFTSFKGGSINQVLAKRSNKDYDFKWVNQGGGGGPSPYTSNPAALSTASPGVSDNYARGDHVHPKPSAADLGVIAAPASPTVGDFLVYTAGGWDAVTMAEWQGGNY